MTKSGAGVLPWRDGLGDRGDLSVGGISSSLRSMRELPKLAADNVSPARCQHQIQNSVWVRFFLFFVVPRAAITPAVTLRKSTRRP